MEHWSHARIATFNILRSMCSACCYFKYWWEIPSCFDFYVVTRCYSSRPFLCALAIHTYTVSIHLISVGLAQARPNCMSAHTHSEGRGMHCARIIDDSHQERWSPSCTLIASLTLCHRASVQGGAHLHFIDVRMHVCCLYCVNEPRPP